MLPKVQKRIIFSIYLFLLFKKYKFNKINKCIIAVSVLN